MALTGPKLRPCWPVTVTICSLMQLDLNKCRNLFEVLECRDPGKSTMVVSQFPVKSWYDLFQEHTYADACLNRMLSNAYRLEMNGKNMRNLNPVTP